MRSLSRGLLLCVAVGLATSSSARAQGIPPPGSLFDRALADLMQTAQGGSDRMINFCQNNLLPAVQRQWEKWHFGQAGHMAERGIATLVLMCDGSVRLLEERAFQWGVLLARRGDRQGAEELQRILIGLLLPAVQQVGDEQIALLLPYIEQDN